MKQLASNYSISNKNVTLTGVNVPLSQILLIANATTGSVLYSMAGPVAASYAQAANSVITLATAPGASDKLTIYYDDGVAASNAPTTVTLGGGSASIGSVNNTAAQFSKITIANKNFSRPADTAAYAANDVISTATSGVTSSYCQFTNVLPVSGAQGYVVAARAMVTGNAFATALRLHLYAAAPTSQVQDNVGFNMLIADFANYVGYIDFSGWTSGATSGSVSDSSVAFGIFPGSGASLPIELSGTSLWAIVETRAAFTPTSGQSFQFSLKTQLT